ncbi:MAG TPA: hypothetical protein DCL75_10080 [Ktedonobacter sp.]|nr:hypothetical protein [Ktedonobacter sp.]
MEESLALFRELRDKRAVIDSLVLLAEERLNSQGDATKARALLEEGLALSRELANTDTAKEGKLLGSLGEISLYQGNMALARSLLEESMTILQGEDMDELINKAWLLSQLAKIAAVQHDYTRARTLYEQSLAINREVFFRVNTPFYSGRIGECGCCPGGTDVGRATLGSGRSPSRHHGRSYPACLSC